MNRTALVVVEGVLQAYQSKAPIPAGILLYHGLKATCGIALITDDTTDEKVQYWLDLHGFTEHNYLFTSLITDPESVADRRMVQLSRARQAGCSIDLLVEPNPAIAAAALSSGIAVLNYLHPLYAKPEFRPDYEGGNRPTSWETLMAESNRQDRLRVADLRLAERNDAE